MKKLSLLAALLGLGFACFSPAQAQTAVPSSVTLYGVLDSGVEYITNVGASSTSLTRVPSFTGTVPSRWGMRGSEDLGGGLRAIFTLESGFGTDTGNSLQGPRLFGRSAFVGLASPWGTLTFGRQYTMYFYSLLDADVMGPNVHSTSSLDSYIPNARADNAIGYRGTFSGLTIGATYSVGRDFATAGTPQATNCAGESSTNRTACQEWSVMLKYDSPAWGVALASDELTGGPGALSGGAGSLALGSSTLHDTRISANGYVKFSGIKLGAGVIQRDNEGNATTPKSKLWFLGVSYPVTPALTVDAQYLLLDFDNSVNKATLPVVRGVYSLSKRTAVYASLGHIANEGTLAISVSGTAPGSAPGAGESQTGVLVGLRHSF